MSAHVNFWIHENQICFYFKNSEKTRSFYLLFFCQKYTKPNEKIKKKINHQKINSENCKTLRVIRFVTKQPLEILSVQINSVVVANTVFVSLLLLLLPLLRRKIVFSNESGSKFIEKNFLESCEFHRIFAFHLLRRIFF